MARDNILFLTLQVFSATGGIEKVCKVVGKALTEIAGASPGFNVKVFSMYDRAGEIDEKYIPSHNFRGFGKQKASFVKAAVIEGKKSSKIILSHVNLLLVGFFIKLFSPKTKIFLFAHGIEVWGPLSKFRKYMLHRCDYILCVSNYTKTRMVEQFKLPEEKLIVLNNCLDPYLPPPCDTEKYAELQKRYKINPGDFVLLTLTRFSSKEKYKGYDNVLYSLNTLRKEYPNIKYLLAGKYDAGEKSRLDAIINKLSLQAYVIFAGYVPDAELAAHYKLANLYVMPSKKEGFGIVFIEAMYYGLPVIAGNADGSVDALCNGKLGLLVNPDDGNELTRTIADSLKNTEKLKPDNGILMEHFSFEGYKKRIQQILLN
ncbi:MAG: glycosyltransferase family 4 protein [Ferruginibacter sp.]